MEVLKKITSVENDSLTLFSLQNEESEIPKWQIDEVRKRTESFLKNPNNADDIDDFLKKLKVI